MNWWQALILGLVQGLTEFLPVSSSGHLVIFRELLGAEAPSDLVFEITVHVATALATIVVFRKQILDLLQGLFKFKYNEQTDFIAKLVVSMIPVAIVGFFFKDKVEELFSSLLVVGCALMVTALLLFLSDRVKARKEGKEITFGQALVMGLGQAVAVIPGLSRSGTTISAGLLSGASRNKVAEFSFLMVLVPILGEAFLDLVGGDLATSSISIAPLVLGFLAAFFSGLFACKAMIALVKKAGLKWFALYCAIVGLIVIICSLV
ncbi:MAG: undecaprenyl-diphosphate phosphatase [Bacteroidales bacterium]|nr:undecaprenyl-diphosphate phosphatase [Bacteroidales bacterium]MBQ4168705.1 undecaprenyl-diphosphate phosphatase [Bacteroidales bacterium]